MPQEPGSPAPTAVLEEVLAESRELGFLGPGDVGPHIEHARRFAGAAGGVPRRFLDLGSGGGLPGLVLALEWRGASAVLLDASVRRTGFLGAACERLGIADRVEVVCARAEDAARRPELREQFDLVVARSFGAPAVTAECAVGFLRASGRVVVSEPPEDGTERWPRDRLAVLGLALARRAAVDRRFAVLELAAPVSDRWPRRVGVPAKRPLWR